MNEKIMIVDDEEAIADLVESYLLSEGYQVFKFYNAADALKCVEREDLSLAILDVMLPDMDGFQLCQQIRRNHFYPIIMLTAKTEDMDKINGLTLGADDYMGKPFNPLELITRIKSQLRRYKRYNNAAETQASETQEIDIRGLYISKSSHKCMLNGKELSFTPIEFSVLWYLCEHRGRVISSEELFENVWGEKYLNDNNTVMAHIARIREKMHEPARNPKYIRTVWGVGYTIE